jgi:hypothetical protein
MRYAIFGGNLAQIGEYSCLGDFSDLIGEKSPKWHQMVNFL